MYRAFLDMCTGALSGDLLTVYAPDDITVGRLENDRVKSALCEEAEKASGVSIRLMFQVGEPPKASPQKNLQNLLKFGSQFDNIHQRQYEIHRRPASGGDAAEDPGDAGQDDRRSG